jgi:large subunit ribosomal protein L30
VAKKLEIKQIRSAIDRHFKQKQTIRALGIRKLNQTVVHNDTPQIRGMIAKVGHLLEVRELDEELRSEDEHKAAESVMDVEQDAEAESEESAPEKADDKVAGESGDEVDAAEVSGEDEPDDLSGEEKAAEETEDTDKKVQE